MGSYPFWTLNPNQLAELQSDTELYVHNSNDNGNYIQLRGYAQGSWIRHKTAIASQSSDTLGSASTP